LMTVGAAICVALSVGVVRLVLDAPAAAAVSGAAVATSVGR